MKVPGSTAKDVSKSYLHAHTPNNFSLAGSQFFPYQHISNERKNTWKELRLNMRPFALQVSA